MKDGANTIDSNIDFSELGKRLGIEGVRYFEIIAKCQCSAVTAGNFLRGKNLTDPRLTVMKGLVELAEEKGIEVPYLVNS